MEVYSKSSWTFNWILKVTIGIEKIWVTNGVSWAIFSLKRHHFRMITFIQVPSRCWGTTEDRLSNHHLNYVSTRVMPTYITCLTAICAISQLSERIFKGQETWSYCKFLIAIHIISRWQKDEAFTELLVTFSLLSCLMKKPWSRSPVNNSQPDIRFT